MNKIMIKNMHIVSLTSDSMLIHVWQLNARHLQHVSIPKGSPVGHFKVKSGQSALTKVTPITTATTTNLINMSDLQVRSDAQTEKASHYIPFSLIWVTSQENIFLHTG